MLELEIENQRLIPVRLIPIVTGWKFSPDEVVRILSQKSKWHRVFIPSFHYQNNNCYAAMLPKEWDVIDSDLDILSKKLKAQESHEDENYHRWREEAIEALPAGTFVWLSELEAGWNSTFSGRLKTMPIERPSDRNLNLNPFISKELYPVIFEGFEDLLSVPTVSLPNTDLQYIIFHELHQYMVVDPFYGMDSAATESIVNEIYRENANNDLFLMFRDSYALKPFKSDKVRELISLWCAFLGLPAYQKNNRLSWQWNDYTDSKILNFQVSMTELRELLRKYSWPLPSRIYPGEYDCTERKVTLEDHKYKKGFEIFAVFLPRLKRDLEELQNMQPESMDALKQRKSEIELIEQEIAAIKTGRSVLNQGTHSEMNIPFDSHVLESDNGTNGATQNESGRPCDVFLAMEKLTANELSIAFVGQKAESGIGANNSLEISARNIKKRVALASLNLVDRRRGELNSQGVILLGLARKGMILPRTGRNAKSMSRLREVFRIHLGIQANPFHTYSKSSGWEPRFTISDKRGAADERATREAELRLDSFEQLTEKGHQFDGQTYDNNEGDSESDPASDWLKENDTDLSA